LSPRPTFWRGPRCGYAPIRIVGSCRPRVREARCLVRYVPPPACALDVGVGCVLPPSLSGWHCSRLGLPLVIRSCKHIAAKSRGVSKASAKPESGAGTDDRRRHLDTQDLLRAAGEQAQPLVAAQGGLDRAASGRIFSRQRTLTYDYSLALVVTGSA